MINWYKKRDYILIVSFADQETEDIYHGAVTKKARRRLPVILWEKAQTKLDMIDKAKQLEDLKAPPNNRLEKLIGDLSGYHSIRINDQYRIVFDWKKESSSARDVKIIDYH